MKQKDWLLVVLSVGIVQLLYWPTRLAGFVTDYTGLAERIETHGAGGILSSFGFPALQPVTSVFYYSFYHGFGSNSWGWHIVYTLLHTANALLLFRFIRRLLPATDDRSYSIAAFGALLFLLSPYAAEVVIWRVGFHYLLVTCLVLIALWYTLSWLQRPNPRSWWLIMLVQLLALLTYELAIILPPLCLILGLWQAPVPARSRMFTRLCLPQFALVGFYFVGNKLLLGNWIGHYGSAVHLKFPLAEMTGNISRYFFKWVGFSRYWPHPWKEGLAQTLIQPWAIGLLLVVVLVIAYFILKRFRTADTRWRLTWAFTAMAIVALFPVLNLYFNYLLHIENDRYGYLAAVFFYPTWIALLSRLPKHLFLSIGVLYVLFSTGFLWQTNKYWSQSNQVYRNLLADFDAYDHDTCYLLNLPDNLQGAPMFRDYSGQDRAFADALRYVKGQAYNGTMHEVVQYNMATPGDGVQIEQDSIGLKVTFNQWGNWWWRRGIGASSYRDSSYIFHNEGHHYRLEWREQPEGAELLYQDGMKWLPIVLR